MAQSTTSTSICWLNTSAAYHVFKSVNHHVRSWDEAYTNKSELIFNWQFRLAVDVMAQPGMSPDIAVLLLVGAFGAALQSARYRTHIYDFFSVSLNAAFEPDRV
jgi:hypothetical protein